MSLNNLAVILLLAAAASAASLNSEDVHQKRAVLNGQEGPVKALAFSPDGNLLIAAGGPDAVVWDIRVMDLPVEKARLAGHQASIDGVAYSPDGRWAATSGLDKTIRLWRMPRARLERVIDLRRKLAFCVAFSTGSDALALGLDDGTIEIRDVPSGRHRLSLAGHVSAVDALAYSRQGILASAGEDGRVDLWDLAHSSQAAVSWPAHDGSVNALAFSPDGQTLASGGFDRRIKIWSAASGRFLGLLTGHADAITSLAFLPDGTLISGGKDQARFWDPETGVEKQALSVPDDDVLSVAAHPSGTIIASGNADGSARLYLVRVSADWRAEKSPPAPEPTTPW